MKLIVLALVFISACAGCKKLNYVSDLGFLSSAQANSPEYLVKINERFCKDLDGQMGLCAKRVKSDEKILFKLDARPYSYRLVVSCSSLVDFSLTVDVVKGKGFSFEITPEQFQNAKSYTCVGEVFPHDRDEQVSAFFHVRFIVVDSQYMGRESIYEDSGTLILGSNALYSLINETKQLKSKTLLINAKGVEKVMTESHLMRFSYWGY